MTETIQEFYKDKSIFITGASGFMGKVLLEKLLYSCVDIKQIFILMRPKKGKSPEERITDMIKLPLFHRIRESKPEMFKKIIPVFGDIINERLGLSDEHFELLTSNTQIVFHMAATLKLEATLKPAVEMNLGGTQHVLDVCKSMSKLVVLLHLSTAFCNCDQEVLREEIYDWPHPPKDLINCARWMSEESMDSMAKTLMEPHPNTYTYTKRLAEILVRDEYPNLPVCVVRPSIVTPAWREPLPGWVDSLNGPIGIMVGGGKGVIRSLLCNGEYTAEVIPVDQAISGLIAIAWTVGTLKEKPKKIPVFNVTCSEEKRITWGTVLNEGKRICYEYPFEAGLWFPDGGITTNKFYHYLNAILFMWLPAYFIDFLMLLFGQRRFMVRIQNRIHIGLFVLQFFTMRKWDFRSENFKAIYRDLPAAEKEIFNMNTEAVDTLPYLKDVILGGREYCLKEPPSSLPKARIHLKIQWAVDRLVKILWVYFFLNMFLKITGLKALFSGTTENQDE